MLPTQRPRSESAVFRPHEKRASRVERRSDGMTELSRLRGSDGYAVRDDAGVWGAFFWQAQKKASQRCQNNQRINETLQTRQHPLTLEYIPPARTQTQTTLDFSVLHMYNIKAMQRYRSGHNGADSKSVCRQLHEGSNPSRCATPPWTSRPRRRYISISGLV